MPTPHWIRGSRPPPTLTKKRSHWGPSSIWRVERRIGSDIAKSKTWFPSCKRLPLSPVTVNISPCNFSKVSQILQVFPHSWGPSYGARSAQLTPLLSLASRDKLLCMLLKSVPNCRAVIHGHVFILSNMCTFELMLDNPLGDGISIYLCRL